MISERDIAEKFSVLWKQSFPLLTPNFIRVLNEARTEEINTNIVINNEEVRYDLVSEAAFNLAEIVITKDILPIDYLSNSKRLKELITRTAKTIWATGNYSSKDLKISKNEADDILKISTNIVEFVAKIGGNIVEFRPKLKGYSFVPDLEADLLIDDTLYEIKTVARNFKSSDLKQLFLYLALQQMSDNENYNYGGLYNPRKGIYFKFNVKSLVYNLSGGKTPNEAFEGLLNGLVRDVEVDSRF